MHLTSTFNMAQANAIFVISNDAVNIVSNKQINLSAEVVVYRGDKFNIQFMGPADDDHKLIRYTLQTGNNGCDCIDD